MGRMLFLDCISLHFGVATRVEMVHFDSEAIRGTNRDQAGRIFKAFTETMMAAIVAAAVMMVVLVVSVMRKP